MPSAPDSLFLSFQTAIAGRYSLEGETLTERVRQRGPLPPSEAARVVREVAWALAYAHSQGVVHRDVKPDNIMIESGSGRALVADFGIAGLVKGATGVDGGEVIG